MLGKIDKGKGYRKTLKSGNDLLLTWTDISIIFSIIKFSAYLWENSIRIQLMSNWKLCRNLWYVSCIILIYDRLIIYFPDINFNHRAEKIITTKNKIVGIESNKNIVNWICIVAKRF